MAVRHVNIAFAFFTRAYGDVNSWFSPMSRHSRMSESVHSVDVRSLSPETIALGEDTAPLVGGEDQTRRWSEETANAGCCQRSTNGNKVLGLSFLLLAATCYFAFEVLMLATTSTSVMYTPLQLFGPKRSKFKPLFFFSHLNLDWWFIFEESSSCEASSHYYYTVDGGRIKFL